MEIKIQKARFSDVDEVANLVKILLSFEGKLDSNYAPAKNVERKFKTYLKRNLRRNDFIALKAVCNGETIGHIAGWIQEKPAFRKLRRVGYIETLFVAEPHRKGGVATILITELLRWFRSKGVGHAEAVVISRNKGAIRFYKKLGFREIHRKYTIPIR